MKQVLRGVHRIFSYWWEFMSRSVFFETYQVIIAIFWYVLTNYYNVDFLASILLSH